jgi:hypothetical protein
MVGDGQQAASQGCVARVAGGRVRETAGVDDQFRTAGGFEPVDATLQVVDRIEMGRGVERTEVDPISPDRFAPPAAVGAVDRQASAGNLRPEQARVGEGLPERQDFEDGCADPFGQIEFVVEASLREAVNDHRSERASGQARLPCRQGRARWAPTGGDTSCRTVLRES